MVRCKYNQVNFAIGDEQLEILKKVAYKFALTPAQFCRMCGLREATRILEEEQFKIQEPQSKEETKENETKEA